MKYTLQAELDVKSLGAMWGCTFTGFINLFEHNMQSKATEAEINQFTGAVFRNAFADMANYKHHDYGTDNDLKPPTGWDAKANPEWHYYVKGRLYIYAEGVKVFKRRPEHMRYRVALMRTQYGGIHYCLLAPFDDLINPDPALEGPIEEIRPFIY